MAAPTARELQAALEERRSAQYYVDAWNGLTSTYHDFHERLRQIHHVYNGEWGVVWPDGEYTEALPKVANLVQIAADDKSNVVAAITPSIVRRPQKQGDAAQRQADKVERITTDWLRRSRVWGDTTKRWALDGMAGGLMATKVWMDTSKPVEERYPTLHRVRSGICYPSPTFAAGPKVDSMIVSKKMRMEDIAAKYPQFRAQVDWGKDPTTRGDQAHIIEYYDDTWVVIVVDPIKEQGYHSRRSGPITVVEERHDLGVCPFSIGTRATMTDEYRGEFYGSLGILNFANRLRTLMLDDAIHKVYPERIKYNVENDEVEGPGADIELQTPDARYEYVQQPNQPFSNLQIMRDLMGEGRAAVVLPPSRSGDPNESIISAAGIGAANTQFQMSAASVQKDMLAPMLEHAVYIAGKWDRAFGEASKPINASSGSYVENYTPSKDVPDELHVEVRYGESAGLDPINHGVMVLQQRGAGLISQRTAMELSPFVEDPQREEKQQLKESLTQALQAGLITQAANGQLTSMQIAEVMRLVDSENVSLADAVAQVAPLAPAPLAAPAASPGATPEAPGLAGAAAPTNSQSLPPAAELMGF